MLTDTTMSLTERARNLSENYLSPVVEGLTTPYTIPTAYRRLDDRLQAFYDGLNSKTQVILTFFGIGGGGLSLLALDDIAGYMSKNFANQPFSVKALSMAGAVAATNLLSLAYERKRKVDLEYARLAYEKEVKRILKESNSEVRRTRSRTRW